MSNAGTGIIYIYNIKKSIPACGVFLKLLSSCEIVFNRIPVSLK